jgi:hypothetical protein
VCPPFLAAGVVDTGGKFAAGVVDTGGKKGGIHSLAGEGVGVPILRGEFSLSAVALYCIYLSGTGTVVLLGVLCEVDRG